MTKRKSGIIPLFHPPFRADTRPSVDSLSCIAESGTPGERKACGIMELIGGLRRARQPPRVPGVARHAERVRDGAPRPDCRFRPDIVWGTVAATPGRRTGPVAQWLEPTAHNGLVGGSSPPGPTTHSCSNRHFSALDTEPQLRPLFAGRVDRHLVSVARGTLSEAVSGLCSLASANPFL